MLRSARFATQARDRPSSWVMHLQASRFEAQTPSCAFSNRAHSAFRIPSSAFIFSARVLKASVALAEFPARDLVSPAFPVAAVAGAWSHLSRLLCAHSLRS